MTNKYSNKTAEQLMTVSEMLVVANKLDMITNNEYECYLLQKLINDLSELKMIYIKNTVKEEDYDK